MRRSLWKGVFCFKGVLKQKGDMVIGKTWDRSYVITSQLSNGVVLVKNICNEERTVRLVPARNGYRIGSFVLTKKLGAIHNMEGLKKKGKK